MSLTDINTTEIYIQGLLEVRTSSPIQTDPLLYSYPKQQINVHVLYALETIYIRAYVRYVLQHSVHIGKQ